MEATKTNTNIEATKTNTNMEATKNTNMKWYIVKTAYNREKSTAEKIKKEGEIGTLIGKVGRIVVPLEKSFYLKDNKKVSRETVTIPGYVFAETNSIGDMKYFITGLKGASGFLTSRLGTIESLTEAEVNRMIGKQEENFSKKEEEYSIGEEISIIDGPFSSMRAAIEKIEDQKVTLSVSIFGRKTPLVLDINQISKK